MELRHLLSFLLLVFLSLFVTSAGFAQPKTTRPAQKEAANAGRETRKMKAYRNNILLFQPSRLLSNRFPSTVFSYERRLGDFLGATALLGVANNRLNVYRESDGEFSGVEVGLGFKAYTSYNQRKRMYFQLEGILHHNPVTPTVFVSEPGRPTSRAQALKITRKRQLAALTLGSQLVTYYGLTFDFRIGLSTGRRGVFSENEKSYLSVAQENFFSAGGPPQNRWGSFIDGFIGFGLGYAF